MTNLDIETFWAVVQHGTMTAAAEALYITQPTLSMRIRALEERVGTPLFVRGKGQRRIQLTAAGQKFLTLARRWQRLLSETDRLLCGAHVLPVLLAYPDVLGVFLPELLPCVGLDQRNRHHLYDVWEHTARSVAAIPPEPVLRWAMLLHDVGKPACFTVDDQGVGHFYGHPKVSASLAEDICRRLRMDKRTAHEIVTLVQWHDRDIPRTERAIARAVHQLGEDTFRRLLAIKRADNLAQHPAYRGRLTELDRAEAILDALLAKQACFSLRDLAVDGRDMLALGLRGPAVGHTLDALLAQVLDGALPNDRAALLAAARKTIQ